MQENKALKPVNTFWRRNEAGREVLHVDNPELKINAGDTVTINMPDLEDPVIMIPVAGIFAQQIFTARPGSKTLEMKVMDHPAYSDLTFAYALYSREIDDFAVGNSPPRMILGDGTR